MSIVRRCACAVALATVSIVVHAQTAPPPPESAASDGAVLDAKAAVPALRYRSVLGDFGSKLPTPQGSWQQANDLSHLIGGWRSYARQAQQADEAIAPAAAGKGASQPTPASSTHPHKH